LHRKKHVEALLLRACEFMRARHYKTWRIYCLPLE
jgi:hypothetical protein